MYDAYIHIYIYIYHTWRQIHVHIHIHTYIYIHIPRCYENANISMIIYNCALTLGQCCIDVFVAYAFRFATPANQTHRDLCAKSCKQVSNNCLEHCQQSIKTCFNIDTQILKTYTKSEPKSRKSEPRGTPQVRREANIDNRLASLLVRPVAGEQVMQLSS